MRFSTMALTAALAMILMTCASLAQPPGPPEERRGRPGRPGRLDRRGDRPERAAREPRQRQGERPVHPLMVALDLDKDGKLSAAEIANAADALKKLDKDGDGTLSRRELRPPWAQGAPGDRRAGPGEGGPSAEQFVQRIMRRDTDGDGKISKEELPEQMQRIFDRADENQDNFIDAAEARAMAERVGRRGRGERGGQRPRGRRPRPPADEGSDAP